MKPADLQKYLTCPRMGASSGVVLAIRLLKAAPPRKSDRIVTALTALRERSVELQAVARDRIGLSARNLRPLDQRFGNSWMGLYEALGAAARLSGTKVEKDAAVLLRKLFPRGAGFVKASYEHKWVESATILTVVERDRLGSGIARVAGKHYLPFIRAAHDAFGEALGVGPTPLRYVDTKAIAKALDALADAVLEYCRLMVGWVDLDDDESVAAFRDAMWPLDEHRRTMGGSRRDDEEEEVEDDVVPTDPIPPLDVTPEEDVVPTDPIVPLDVTPEDRPTGDE